MIILSVLVLAIFIISLDFIVVKNDYNKGGFIGIGVVILIFLSVGTTGSYFRHATDIGTIRAQYKVILVYKQNVSALEEKLHNLKEYKTSLMNNDAPVTSLVKAISESMYKLALAKEKKANAYVSISRRAAGPWSFLVSENDLK